MALEGTSHGVIAEAIPAELRRLPQWVLWRWEQRAGKWTKPPLQASGEYADSTDPATWTTFDAALHAYEAGGFDGLGFALTPALGCVGFDLDHALNDDGTLQDWARRIVDECSSYTEVSPSGAGLRIFMYGALPPKDRKIGDFECYCDGRYLTLTGHHLPGTPETIQQRQDAIHAIRAWMFAPRNERRKGGPPVPAQPVSLDDQELLAKAFSAPNGAALQRLYEGDYSGYPSHSEGDLALASRLGYWAGGEFDRVDRLFRASDMYRPKWDERRGADTYGTLTIGKALAGLTEVYTPSPHSGPATNAASVNTSNEWTQPLPFDEYTVPPFPLHTLPDAVCALVKAETSVLQVPPDLVAVLVIGVGAAAAARRAVMRLAPDWTEPLNLYVVVVLPSGERKSPVFRDVTRPLQDRERELVEVEKPNVAQAEAERDVLEKRLQGAKSAAAKAKDGEREAAMEEVAELARALAEYEVPRLPRLLADDVTAEAIATLLAEHRQIAVMSTEGGIFETMAGRYAQGVPNLDVYLKGFTGDTLRVDRKTRPPEHVERPALTMALTVQPAVVQDLAVKPGFRGRGLLARFLYALPQSLVGYRSLDAPAVPRELRRTWDETVRAILRLPFPPPGEDEHEFRVSAEGTRHFDEFREEVEVALRLGGALDGIQDWGNKLPGTVARIAGILHLFQHADAREPWSVTVSMDTMKVAVQLGRYFTGHAIAAFAMMGADPAIANAKHVLAWITREERTSFTQNEVWRATRGRFSKVEPLKAALRVLEEHGFIQSELQRQEGAGRPATHFIVNPIVLAQNGKNGQNSPFLGNSSHSSHFSQQGNDDEENEEEKEWRG